MSLTQPSRTIVVEPLRVAAPAPAPAEPLPPEPREPAPAPLPARTPAGA